MPRGMQRSKPAKPATDAGQWDTGAGQFLPEQPAATPAPAAVPPATPRQTSRGVADGLRRQTLDIPRDHYRTLHHYADAIAEGMGVTSRQINAQTVLRELVARYVNDEELRDSINRDVRRPFAPEQR